MKNYQKNPRKISQEQLNDLQRWMQEFGDLGCIVHNELTDEVLSANQRMKVIGLDKVEIVIEETFEPPTAQGTTARGYVQYAGEKFTYRRVRWEADKAKQAVLIANKAGGEWDDLLLATEFDGVLEASGFSAQEIETILKKAEIELPDLPEEDVKPVYPIVQRFSEEYNALVIVCDNAIDWNWLNETLQLESQQSYKSGEIGLTRVIPIQKLIALWKSPLTPKGGK